MTNITDAQLILIIFVGPMLVNPNCKLAIMKELAQLIILQLELLFIYFLSTNYEIFYTVFLFYFHRTCTEMKITMLLRLKKLQLKLTSNHDED